MTIVIDLSVEAEGWSRLLDTEGMIQRAIDEAAALSGLALLQGAEVSVLLCDDARIRALNRDWRGFDKATNVLSFPASLPGPLAQRPFLGDIAIALETSAREADEERTTFPAHVTHLAVHGFLHLIGFDHETDPDADVMERLEARILAELGIADPYADEAAAEVAAE